MKAPQYVSVQTNTLAEGEAKDDIVLAIVGPRGGLQHTAGLTLDNARGLVSRLLAAIRRAEEAAPVEVDPIRRGEIT